MGGGSLSPPSPPPLAYAIGKEVKLSQTLDCPSSCLPCQSIMSTVCLAHFTYDVLAGQFHQRKIHWPSDYMRLSHVYVNLTADCKTDAEHPGYTYTSAIPETG